ncbi:MAG: T9SS type A sorting domain-containing protein [Fimbriimonadaceae bacterium]|nr:T9SS type A sorting domain-containing protein [Chitinophagales bacterium]
MKQTLRTCATGIIMLVAFFFSTSSIIAQCTVETSVVADGPLALCEGQSVTLTAYPAGDGYAYSWGILGSGIFTNTQSITVSEAATYVVHITDASGCHTEPSGYLVEVTVNPVPECSISGELEFCEGESTTLTGPDGYSYLWSTGETTQSITVSDGGVYTLTVSNDSDCSSTCEVEVTENPKPDAYVEADGPTTICGDGCVTLTVFPAGDDFTYQWGLVGGAIFATTQSITICESGSYAVHITNATGCGTDPSGIITDVNIYPAPVCSIDGDLSICEGDSTTLTAPDGYTYSWSNGATTQSIIVTEGGIYTLTVTNEFGCTSTCEVEVVVNPTPDAYVVVDGSTNLCGDECVTLTAYPAGDDITYDWGLVGGGGIFAHTQSITVCDAGEYAVHLHNATGCGTDPSGIITIVTENPAPICSIDGDLSICEGDSTTLTAPDGYTYLWSTGATTQSITVTVAGVYSVTLTNDAGCSSTCEVEVIVNEKPDASFEGETVICPGSCTTLTVFPAGDGFTYEWGIVDGAIFATTQSVTICEPGSYAVHITNATGCGTDPSGFVIDVTEGTGPDATITPNGTIETCAGTPVLLTANIGTGLTYQWYKDGVAIPGAVAKKYKAKTSGTYTVVVTNAEGCSTTSEGVVITANPGPLVSFATPEGLDLCGHDDGLLFTTHGLAGTTFQWYLNGSPIAGATDDEYVATSTGVYQLIATNSSGCVTKSKKKTVVNSCRVAGTIEPADISIYPNPTENDVIVTFNLPDANEVTIEVKDIQGRVLSSELVATGGMEVSTDISFVNYTKGVYFVVFITDTERITREIIVQ